MAPLQLTLRTRGPGTSYPSPSQLSKPRRHNICLLPGTRVLRSVFAIVSWPGCEPSLDPGGSAIRRALCTYRQDLFLCFEGAPGPPRPPGGLRGSCLFITPSLADCRGCHHNAAAGLPKLIGLLEPALMVGAAGGIHYRREIYGDGHALADRKENKNNGRSLPSETRWRFK